MSVTSVVVGIDVDKAHENVGGLRAKLDTQSRSVTKQPSEKS